MSQHCLRCTVDVGHSACNSIVYSLKFVFYLKKLLSFFNSAMLAVFPSLAMILQRQ
jgi:hypothetical protein